VVRPETALAPGSRVCVILLTGLGDVVNALPLVNALKDHDPTVRIDWVVEPMPAPILDPHPSVDGVIVYRRRDGIRGVLRLARDMLARPRYDVVLALHPYFKGVWGTVLSRAPRRIGWDRARSFDAVWLAATERLRAQPRAHTLDMFLEFAAHLGVPVPRVEWRIPITEVERAEQRAFVATLDRPLAVVVPTSANARKDWPAERWTRIVDVLHAGFGFRVALLGGGGARDAEASAQIADAARHPPLPLLGGPLRRAVWTLEGASLVLGPDTGPLHLARALGTPVIGLFGHTNPWRTGPYRAGEDLWIDRYTDRGTEPDPSDFRPRHGRMESITVEEVVERIRKAIPSVLARDDRRAGS
jgi:heptosyltransferase I